MPSGIKYLWFTSQGGSKGPFLVEVPCLKKKKYKTKLKIKNKKMYAKCLVAQLAPLSVSNKGA